MIPWLEGAAPFPPAAEALRYPNGLLCAGGDLSPGRLLAAYRNGIFPWFSAGEPILWWSPDPRMVLFPEELKISRSLARTLRRGGYTVRLDTAFAEVIHACSLPRPGQDGTWITPSMQKAYLRLHQLGHAHCVETWIDGALAGGLYGVAIGRAFYGESMFTRLADASKIALAHLARYLERRGFAVIDCQMKTAHLASFGAREIRRDELAQGLAIWTCEGEAEARRWPPEDAATLFAAEGGA
ncbi:MAG: leucyl/phenylalanyl-tRNA--protein transferase [Zoogloeaceae bacterium]|jgi:leucyl/phenylalanyl-tRNA--protein transferase|nr:leucyl/phenylalanyl-tRNA--protein transferase [Zoogloeaceae bacterium]